MLEGIVIWLQELIRTIGPLGVALGTLIENIFPPIPSEIILITAGTIAENPQMLIMFIIAATIGSYFGTLPFYAISRKSRALVMRLIDKWGVFFLISRKEVEWTESKFAKHGNAIVFWGRMLPTIRSVISIPAGIADMPFIPYTIYTLIGSMFWNILLIGAGYLLKDAYQPILDSLESVEHVIIALIILVVLIYIFRVAKEMYSIYKQNKKKV